MRVFVGTYTEGTGSEGIYTLDLNLAAGRVERRLSASSRNPSFLAKRGNRIFAVNELLEEGAAESFVVATDGLLERINRVSFSGSACCHVVVHPSKEFIYLSNYLSGNVAGYRINPDGRIEEQVALVQHQGQGPNAKRQERAHAHSAAIDIEGRRLIVADLGIDRLMVYEIDGDTGALGACPNNPFVEVAPGIGPRHMAFSSSGKTLYLVAELENRVLSFGYEPQTGKLIQKQDLSLLPESFYGESIAADIHLSPDGRFLYASSRGWNGLGFFSVNDDETLRYSGHIEGYGKTPRNFAISKDGDYFLIAYQDSGTVVVMKRNQKTGNAENIVLEIAVPSPVCLIVE